MRTNLEIQLRQASELNLALLGSQPKLCENPLFSFILFIFWFFFFFTSGFLVRLMCFVFRCFRSIKEPKALRVEIWEPNYPQERQSEIWEPNSTFRFVATKPPLVAINQPPIFYQPSDMSRRTISHFWPTYGFITMNLPLSRQTPPHPPPPPPPPPPQTLPRPFNFHPFVATNPPFSNIV